jgi:hypothetical protein
LQQSGADRCHGEAAPTGRRAVEHRPDQAGRAGLAGESTDDLGPSLRFSEAVLDEIRMSNPPKLLVDVGEVQLVSERVLEARPS